MMKDEFIEIVYTFQPLIGNKEKIVRLWAEYANMIIKRYVTEVPADSGRRNRP